MIALDRKTDRFIARFDQTPCANCPLAERCPTKPLRRNRGRALRFSQKDYRVARRRQNQKKAQASDRNLRSAVEATVRSVKHPFGNGKLPVRGKRRVSMMMIASAAMTNVRRIWRYRRVKKAAENTQLTGKHASKPAASFCFWRFLRPFFRFQATLAQYQPAVA